MAGDHPERLDMEGEAGRRALHPELGVALRREAVVGGVDLDRVEAFGVIAQTSLGRLHLGRVPGGRHGAVGPGAGAHPDARHGPSPPGASGWAPAPGPTAPW